MTVQLGIPGHRPTLVEHVFASRMGLDREREHCPRERPGRREGQGDPVTTTHRPSTRIMVMALVAALLLAASPPPANAAQGEVVVSDGDVASHIAQVSNKARATFDSGSILNSCPVGVSSCFLQYRWRSKKNCGLCWWSNDTGWISLAAGTSQLTHCKASGQYQFEVQVRLGWHAPQTQTVRMYGVYEYMWDVGISAIVYRLIPIRLFNFSTNSGMTTAYSLQTNSATSAYSDAYTIATSGANYPSITCP